MKVIMLLSFTFAATPALAQQRVDLAVENLRLDSNAMHAIVRVVNRTTRTLADITVQCAFLSKGKAVDTGLDLVKNLAAGETAYANVVGPIGTGAREVDEARCRISTVR